MLLKVFVTYLFLNRIFLPTFFVSSNYCSSPYMYSLFYMKFDCAVAYGIVLINILNVKTRDFFHFINIYYDVILYKNGVFMNLNSKEITLNDSRIKIFQVCTSNYVLSEK